MSITEVIFNPQLVKALLVYGALSIALAAVKARLHGRFEHSANQWSWDHFFVPLLRAAVLMGFILLAYPVIFGIQEAPPVSELLSGGKGRFGHLLGIVFILSLLLPILPLFSSLPALVLPIQGIATAALVYHWMTAAMGVTSVSYWPGIGTVGLILALAWGTHKIATHTLGITEFLARNLLDIADLDAIVQETIILILQTPVIIVYTLTLGNQIG